ncbi:hypothetical protein BC6307_14550 [Sutcliffiella cohnii]|uniref:NERD domain-containing protein n=1 Tax=Sutcliffiella cohnii TaxID=33932 RepID=A0A223KSK8_9BACI|nr:nuclease-related domain-containing protein [Sutcliffiella cohnii]AST92426.1 hypothetical protein BC6307_14550 [Sutcliffiella cohnii]
MPIIKPRKKPILIRKYEALLARIHGRHPKRNFIESDYRKYNAGYLGELATDYQLGFIDEKKFYILQDLKLTINNHKVQMDTLLLTKKCIILIETKNLNVHLIFEENKMTRNLNDKIEGFVNPLLQVQRQEYRMKQWFQQNYLRLLPIYSLIVISNPNTFFDTSKLPSHLSDKVIGIDALPWKIESIEKNIKNTLLNEADVRSYSKKLLLAHTPDDTNLLEKYDFLPDEVQKGVRCPKCNRLPLPKVKNTWACPNNCDNEKKSFIYTSLKDYALLFKNKLTNQKCREFLLIPSRNTMTRILHSLPKQR